jgi:tryptophan-rich sensory protein
MQHMRKKLFIRISIGILVCLVVGFLGSIATQSSVNDWYPTLNKPVFNPPSWLFAPVWTFLYVLMGIAVGIVWAKGTYHSWVKTALYHFCFQLLLNLTWSVVFFGLEAPFYALIVIVGLLILIILTIKWFRIVKPIAGYLLIPYLLWVLFASVLNFEIWRLN